MKKFITFTLVGTLALLMLVGCGSNTENNNTDNQTITDNVNPSDTPTPSPTDEPTTTPTPSPTETPTPTPEPTETPTPTPEPHTHSYSESITKDATCTEVGEKTFTCECGEKYTENIPATGHQFNEYKSNDDATYTADGTETATCACGSTDTRTVKGSKLTYTYTELSATMYAKSAVNVRDLPSTDGNKLGGLSSGQAVTVTGKCNETGWYRIDYNGSVAYVSNSYLVDNKPVPETPTPTPDPEPTPSNPSGSLAILNTEDGWYLREDGVYQSPASWEYTPTNIGTEWIGKTIAEYCAAQGTSGITFTDPWYCTRFMNVDRWGDYVIGSRKLTTVTYEGCTVDIKIPF